MALLENSLRPLTTSGISSVSRVTQFLLTPSVLPRIPAATAIEKGVRIAFRRFVVTSHSAAIQIVPLSCDDGRLSNGNDVIERFLRIARNMLSENASGDWKSLLASSWKPNWCPKLLPNRLLNLAMTIMPRGHARIQFQKIFAIGLAAMSPKPIRIEITPSTAEMLAETLFIASDNEIVSIKRLATNGLNQP